MLLSHSNAPPCGKIEVNVQLYKTIAPYFHFDLNENKAVRDRSTVGSILFKNILT